MEKNQLEKIIKLYTITNKLKNLERKGWLNWHVEGKRVESVAEHIFGTCMLAVSIYANSDIDINIERVIMMLVLHEIEEIIIGDITPLDIDKLKTKKEDGRKAGLSIFDGVDKAERFLKYIEEFEENKTKEAIFAFECDKFEADLQAYFYKDTYNYEKCKDCLKDERVIKMNQKGFNRVEQYFLQNDKPKLTDEVFTELADFLEALEK